jgi:hypothetical protein
MTLGSLFDGSGGFPLGAFLSGIEPLWASEVEPFPIRVTTKRLPSVKHYGDINKIDGAKVPPVDIITGGGLLPRPICGGKTHGASRRTAGAVLSGDADYFRDARRHKYSTLQATYWTTLSGSCAVWRSEKYSMSRVYPQLEGSGQLAWNYGGFTDVHLRARIAFPQNGSGRAGVFVGNIFCCINIDNQRVELYQSGTLLGSYQGSYSKTPNTDIRTNLNMYLIEMRKRGNNVRIYSGNSNTLHFTASMSAASGYCGIQSGGQIKCELLRLGDACAYEPYEAFDVTMPDGSTESYGRIRRTGVTWDSEFQVFTLQNDVEEPSTRTEDISMDYDFVHSAVMPIPCNADYTAAFTPKGINVWCRRLFLGDSDGFGIVNY